MDYSRLIGLAETRVGSFAPGAATSPARNGGSVWFDELGPPTALLVEAVK